MAMSSRWTGAVRLRYRWRVDGGRAPAREGKDMAERVVLCYGDSNTHGTMPMDRLEDLGRFEPGARWPGALAAELGL